MKLIESSENWGLTEGVKYNGEHPYIQDLVTGEKHPVTANGHELKWRVWVVERSRLWNLAEAGRMDAEPVEFKNQSQEPFFVVVGAHFRIPFQALSCPHFDTNLELVEYVERKKVEYQNFLNWLKAGQKKENFV